MSEWKEIIEEGQVYYVNEMLGNIVKLPADDGFIVVYPKLIKLGPFKTLNDAKGILENKRNMIDNLVDQFNLDLIKGN